MTGAELKGWRLRAQWTQKQLAEALETSVRYIKMIESGKRAMPLWMAHTLHAGLTVQPAPAQRGPRRERIILLVPVPPPEPDALEVQRRWMRKGHG